MVRRYASTPPTTSAGSIRPASLPPGTVIVRPTPAIRDAVSPVMVCSVGSAVKVRTRMGRGIRTRAVATGTPDAVAAWTWRLRFTRRRAAVIGAPLAVGARTRAPVRTWALATGTPDASRRADAQPALHLHLSGRGRDAAGGGGADAITRSSLDRAALATGTPDAVDGPDAVREP